MNDDFAFKHYIIAQIKPLLTQAHKDNIVQFCRMYLPWNVDNWKGRLSSIEAKLTVTSSREKQVCCHQGKDPWALKFTHNYAKLLNSPMVSVNLWCYLKIFIWTKIIIRNICVIICWLFLDTPCSHIRARQHVWSQSKIGDNLCSGLLGVEFIQDWPANFLDLNPIENLWFPIKRKLCDHDTSSLPRLQTQCSSNCGQKSLFHLTGLV